MGVVVALATHARIYGAVVFAASFLAKNARMGVAVATHAGIDAARYFRLGF
jgi:hypothetical protein